MDQINQSDEYRGSSGAKHHDRINTWNSGINSTVTVSKEKILLSFVENLMWTLNYMQYRALEIHAKSSE